MLYTEPLKNNRDFRRIYAKGKSLAHPLLVTYVMRNRLGYNRFGVACSKKVGNAVKRNRAKRIIRQAYYQTEERLGKGFDFVLVARGRTTGAKSTALVPVFLSHAKKLGVLAEKQQSL